MRFWALALMAACHTLNMVPRSSHGLTPYERLTTRKPNVSHLRVFGCAVWYQNHSNIKALMTPRALLGIHVGYCDRSRSYLIYNPLNDTVSRSSQLRFNENFFPYRDLERIRDVPRWHIMWGQTFKEGEPVHRIENSNQGLQSSHPRPSVCAPRTDQSTVRQNSNELYQNSNGSFDVSSPPEIDFADD